MSQDALQVYQVMITVEVMIFREILCNPGQLISKKLSSVCQLVTHTPRHMGTALDLSKYQKQSE